MQQHHFKQNAANALLACVSPGHCEERRAVSALRLCLSVAASQRATIPAIPAARTSQAMLLTKTSLAAHEALTSRVMLLMRTSRATILTTTSLGLQVSSLAVGTLRLHVAAMSVVVLSPIAMTCPAASSLTASTRHAHVTPATYQ